MNVFFGAYTYVNKIYCDREFMSQVVAQLPEMAGKLIVDNSKGECDLSGLYCDHLKGLANECKAQVEIMHLDVEREPREGRLHRRIVQSANVIRDRFLSTEAEWLLIVETDVIPPIGFLPTMVEKAQGFDVFGLPYYRGWHDAVWFLPQHSEVVECHHVLSGCTLYSRRLIEKSAFRYELESLRACPDYWIAKDSMDAGFRNGMFTGLKCGHLANAEGKRGWENL